MTIKLIKRPPDGAELRLEGRLDTVSAPAVQDALLKVSDEYSSIELNFAQLSYISSAGLRVLLVLVKQMNRTGGDLKVTHASDAVVEVFEMTGFSGIIRVE